MIDKDTLKGILADNILGIEFTKKNGEIRHMICTRDPGHIPKNEVMISDIAEENKPKRAGHPDVLAVWDLEKDAWRSFTVSSVTRVQVDSVDILQNLEDEDEDEDE